MAFVVWLVVLFIVGSFAVASLSFAPWIPARTRDLSRIMKLANLKPGEFFYDLGCGNGKVVLYAAKNFGARAIGLEIAIVLYIFCVIQKFLTGNKNAHFKFKNLFSENMSKADVVYFFGLPKTIRNKMKGKLDAELKPGARVISYAFPVEGWTPDVVDKPNDSEVSIYLYKK
ncbi:MAG: SAM-dependent methyltransferase [Patescibacteria group bacterium]